jgi:hypothetical protein
VEANEEREGLVHFTNKKRAEKIVSLWLSFCTGCGWRVYGRYDCTCRNAIYNVSSVGECCSLEKNTIERLGMLKINFPISQVPVSEMKADFPTLS